MKSTNQPMAHNEAILSKDSVQCQDHHWHHRYMTSQAQKDNKGQQVISRIHNFKENPTNSEELEASFIQDVH